MIFTNVPTNGFHESIHFRGVTSGENIDTQYSRRITQSHSLCFLCG